MPVTTDPPRITGSIYPSLQFRSLKISPAENKNVRSPRHLTIIVHFRFSHSCLQLFVTPWIAAHQASLSFTISHSLLKLMSIESVMPYTHIVLCHPLLLLPPIFQSIRVFSNELAFHVRWANYWSSASASVLPMTIQD